VGDDPATFRALNLDGTLRLFDAAGQARILFLSSRAIYGDHRHGELLRETDPATPDSLYGEIKLAAEEALGPRGASLRATGVYGGDKWSPLFAAYLRGDPIASRLATEVHGDDLAAAALLLLARPDTGPFNVSDLLLDRHDLLARVRALTACPHPPPPRASAPPPGVMATDRLHALGWRPGGWPRLDAFLAESLR
jgi:nucleoside-diphosphate-sugar epimerase